MKQLLYSLGPLAPFLVVGCTTSGGTGTLTATWSLQNVDRSPAACMSGYETMLVSAAAWDKNLEVPDPGGIPFIGMFDCAAGMGTLELPLDGTRDTTEIFGKYDIRWDETDAGGGTAVATDMQSKLGRSTTVDLGGGARSTAVTMYQDGGWGWFEWSLYGMNAQTYLDSCAGAGVDKVEITLTEMTTMAVTHLSFPCSTSDDTAAGATGIPVNDLYALGAGIAPVEAGFYTYVATAYAGTTVVGTTDGDHTTGIEALNKISFDPNIVEITLTTR